MTAAQGRAPARSIVMLTADRAIDRRILLEAQALRAAGWQVSILGAPVEPGEVDDPPGVLRVAGGGRRRETRVMRVYAAIRRVLPMNGIVMRALKSVAWRLFIDQERFFERLYAPALARLPAAVYVAHDLPMLAPGRAAASRCGARLVYDSHELYPEQGFPEWLARRWRAIESRHIASAAAVITVNESIARELETRHGLAGVHVIRNAERARDAPTAGAPRPLRSALGLPDGARIVLFQGGLIAGRNLDALVDAMRHVRDPRAHLVLLGDGRLAGRLARRARGLRVHFHAAVPQSALLDWSADADAGIVPYQADCLNNYYCSPNKLFEFIAAGVPVIGSDLPEITRLVRGYDIGMLVGRADAAGIGAAIDAFFADPERLARWRGNVRIAAAELDWRIEARRLVAIFEPLA